jgi:hypothetical protein
MLRGCCLCGQYRYEIAGPISCETVCHCASCRRAAGAPAVAWLTVPRSRFRTLSGSLTRYRSSPQVLRGFCAACGTSVSYEHDLRADELDLTIASLDDPEACPPRDHTWCEDGLSLLKLADGLPSYAETRDQ